MKYPYEVIPPPGQPGGVEAPESCRYPKDVERQLLEAGYTIKLHGKKISKKETRQLTKNSAIDGPAETP